MPGSINHCLDGIYAKLDSAKRKIEDIIAAKDQLGTSGKYYATGQLHPSTGKYVFKAFGPELPLSFSVLAGECVHHMRSCLDHLIWKLVIANGKQPNHRNEFPVCDAAVDYQNACARHKIRGVSSNAASLIEAAQPYHKPNPQIDPIRAVNELDRIDKHRALNITAGACVLGKEIAFACKPSAKISGMSKPMVVTPSVDGVECFYVQFVEPYPNSIKIDPNFEFDVIIANFLKSHNPGLISSLREMYDGTVAVVGQFLSEFPPRYPTA